MPKKIKNSSIEYLRDNNLIRKRLANDLINAGISKFSQLINMSDEQIMSIDWIGFKCLTQINELKAISENNVEFRDCSIYKHKIEKNFMDENGNHICIHCGKPYIPSNKNQRICSPECIKARANQKHIEYAKNNMKSLAENFKAWRKKNKVIKCTICGKPVDRTSDSFLIHKECVINDIKETIKSGQKISYAQYARLEKRNISIIDIREGKYGK